MSGFCSWYANISFSRELYVYIHIHVSTYGKRVQQMQDYCCTIAREPIACGPETVWCGEELPELVRIERGNGIAKGERHEGGKKREEKEESTVSPPNASIARWPSSLSPLPLLFTSFSDSSHFLALFVYPRPSLAFYLCCSVYRWHLVAFSSSLSLPPSLSFFVLSRRPIRIYRRPRRYTSAAR